MVAQQHSNCYHEFVIIDGHIHVWPDKIATRALGQPTPGLRRFGDGTADSAAAALEAAGIDRGICLAVADAPERLEAANRFVGSLNPDRFIGFGSVHPGRTPEENVASLRQNGLRGVKIHPLFQGYALDDRGLWKVLEVLQGEFVAVFHVGPERQGEDDRRATPRMIRDIHEAFPRLDIVAAHLGGYHVMDEALEEIVGLDVHLDTSWPPGIASAGPARVRALIERHGTDKVVFATDWPMANPATEVESIRALGLPDKDTDAILGGNFMRLLGIEAVTEEVR
jgi:predicted TIM-barrel fold metal-dependent hydrolase